MRAGTAQRLAIVGCAAAITLVSLSKPLVIDDAAYHAFARQIAAHPGDPYGFDVFWYEAPQPAHQVLAPPVFLYWWAAGLRLLGDAPWLWKLWTFPFALLLTASLGALLRRFAPEVATPLLCAIALSPAILPAQNLMLDLPALALALAGLALALRACDPERTEGALGTALLAGLLAGLSLQTKYTAVLPLLAGLLHALRLGRPGVAAAQGGLAASIFLGFELWVAHTYGTSHFAEGLRQVREMDAPGPLHWAGALLGLLGSAATGTGLLACLALGASRRQVLAAAGVATAGVLGVAALPGAPLAGGEALSPVWRAELWIFVPLGAAVLLALAALSWQQARRALDESDGAGRGGDVFVLLWLGIELVGFFLVSPFPALRRLVGLQVATGVLVARALSWRRRRGEGTPLLTAGVAWCAALGLLFAASDVSDAWVRHDVLERAVARLDAEPSLPPGHTRWYVGHWGFQFQAERHGLRPVVPGESRLRPGDAVVVPAGVYRQPFRVPSASLVQLDVVSGANPWPWSTLPFAYSGYPPLRPQPDAQIRIRLGRVVLPTTPR